MATIEESFEMVQNLTEELVEKEEKLMKLEEQIETQKNNLMDCDEIIYHYCIKVGVYNWCECSWRGQELDKGESDICWDNCFECDSPMREKIATQENLDAIIWEFRHLKGKWRFYWDPLNYDLMVEKLYDPE